MKVVQISVSAEGKVTDPQTYGSRGAFVSMTIDLDESEAGPKARRKIVKHFQKELRSYVDAEIRGD